MADVIRLNPETMSDAMHAFRDGASRLFGIVTALTSIATLAEDEMRGEAGEALGDLITDHLAKATQRLGDKLQQMESDLMDAYVELTTADNTAQGRF